jgi:hypothetical protein
MEEKVERILKNGKLRRKEVGKKLLFFSSRIVVLRNVIIRW